jgi:hypothetical protein
MTDKDKLILALGAAGALSLWYRSLPPTQRETFLSLAEVGIVSGAVGIPLGLWALERWPDKHYIAAALLTAAGFGIKQLMLSGPTAEHTELPTRTTTATEGEIAEVSRP